MKQLTQREFKRAHELNEVKVSVSAMRRLFGNKPTKQVKKAISSATYEEYLKPVPRHRVPKLVQGEIPFYAPSTEDLYKLLIEIRDSVEELHARQGV